MKNVIGDPIVVGDRVLPLAAGIDDGRTIYTSGQLALVDGKLQGDGIEEQTVLAINNIEVILRRADLSLADVVKTTIWLTSPADFSSFNAVYEERFGPTFPARSTVVAQLLVPGALVEIEAIAVR